MKKYFYLIIGMLILGFQNEGIKNENREDKIEYLYQYSVLAGLNNSIFSGDLTIKELKTKGDLGVGSYSGFDGELVMVDGKVYQVFETGEIRKAPLELTTPYVTATFFDKDATFQENQPVNYEKLKEVIESKLPSKNYFYALKITGNFNSVLCVGAPKQEKPYTKTLADIIPVRPQFKAENINGTIVGFWCPSYVGEVTLAGFHLHFVSDNLKIGGHLIDFESSDLLIEYDEIMKMTFDLQDNELFRESELKPNQGY